MKFFIFLLLFFFYEMNSQSINIDGFGVNGFDRNDDTANFDSAIEHICKTGGTLYIPEGNYYLNDEKRLRSGVNNNNNIFLISKSFTIKLHKNAVLHFENSFKGFRFRSVNDPNEYTVRKYEVIIEGGIINGKNNFNKISKKGNPDMWCFAAETICNFKVKSIKVKNFNGTAAVASYSNDSFTIINSQFYNVTGNPNDLTDNHGDAIYVSNTSTYTVKNNKVENSLTNTNRIGRVGICVEYEGCTDGVIEENKVSGYDRGIHVEFIKGSANIRKNSLIGNSSGIVLWNNYKNKQVIDSNIISYAGLEKGHKSLLYTSSPILMLGYNTNNNSIIMNNQIIIEKEFYIPNNLLQITSSYVDVKDNMFIDQSNALSLAIAQGMSHEKKVSDINFTNNSVQSKIVYAYDVSNLKVIGNKFNVSEMTISFDNSKNIFDSNQFEEKYNKERVIILGKYN